MSTTSQPSLDEAGGPAVAGMRTTPGSPVVADVMTRTVLSVPFDMPVERVAGLFLEAHVSGAPVVDEHGAVVGVVSKSDLVRFYAERDGATLGITSDPARATRERLRLGVPRGFRVIEGAGTRVSDLMTPLTFSVSPGATVEHAAALMAWEGVHRLIVLDADARPCGIVSSLDLVRWVARDVLRSGRVRHVGRPPLQAVRD